MVLKPSAQNSYRKKRHISINTLKCYDESMSVIHIFQWFVENYLKKVWNSILFEVANQKISLDWILIPFCDQKRYFAFLSFYVDKMVMKQKYQMKLPIIPGSRIRKFHGIGFSTSFCNQKRYFAFFRWYWLKHSWK